MNGGLVVQFKAGATKRPAIDVRLSLDEQQVAQLQKALARSPPSFWRSDALLTTVQVFAIVVGQGGIHAMSKHLCFALAFLVGCAYSPNNIPLVWKPEREHSAAPTAAPVDFFKAKIRVAPMTDSRENPKLIGENREGPTPKPATTNDDVAAFVTDHFKTLLSGAGLTVVDSGESAIIKGDI